MVSRWASSAVLYRSVVQHTRRQSTRYRFRHRTYYWLVDVDDLPRPPWLLRPLAGFAASDHTDDPRTSIRDDLARFQRESHAEPPAGKILMLAQARVFGHVFNPLTVFWLYDAEGGLQNVIAEVRNTYGGRHRYLLRTDETGNARAVKRFYVSPFFPVDGEYRLRLPEPDTRLRLAVSLERHGRTSFTASLVGRRRPVTASSLLQEWLRRPFSTAAVSIGIRWHGVRLYLRGLRVHPSSAPASLKGQR